MRHETPFPQPGNILLSYLEDAWVRGLLDKYPPNHLIIEALENRVTGLEYLKQLVNHNAFSCYSPISIDGKIDYCAFSENFIINLSMKLLGLSKRFSGNKFDDFILNQLSASTKSGDFSIDKFLQALSEIEILSFFSKNEWDEYIYENPLGINGANPEATFVKNVGNKIIRVNIEVKTPEFKIVFREQKKILPAFLLSKNGRNFYKEQCKKMNVDFIQPRVTKLAEFLESATKKFNDCSNDEINLLFINWTFSDFEYGGFLEAWSILTNSENGILNHKDIAISLPFSTKITNETFKKISAVVVYTSSLDEMMFNDFRHVWIRHPVIDHHFRMFIMDKNPFVISFIRSITGMNPDTPGDPLILPIDPMVIKKEDDLKYALLYDMMLHSIDDTILKSS